jgi:acetyl esterase
MRLLLVFSLLSLFPLFGELRRDIEFAKPDGYSLTLDAWVPDGPGPFPTVIVVHGGGWEAGDKNTYVPPLFPPLIRGGFAWFTINYRLSPRFQHPAALDDVNAAILWVKRNAAAYKVDPARIALMGESAGGHLVALAGAKHTPATRVAAVVCFYCPTDFEARSRLLGGPGKNVSQLLGVTGMTPPELAKMREASGITYVKRDMPPILFIHGTKDDAVPFAQSTAMCAKMKAVGASCEVFPVPDAPHGVGPWEKVPAYQAYKEKMVEWLKLKMQ